MRRVYTEEKILYKYTNPDNGESFITEDSIEEELVIFEIRCPFCDKIFEIEEYEINEIVSCVDCKEEFLVQI